MAVIFLASSLRMSMMYLLRKMMLSSSLSSTFSRLKKRRHAAVISPEKPPKSPLILSAKLRISVVRYSLQRSLQAKTEWNTAPSAINNSPIYICSPITTHVHLPHTSTSTPDFSHQMRGYCDDMIPVGWVVDRRQIKLIIEPSKMQDLTIPDMNRKLQSLSAYFSQKSTVFCQEINRHEGQLTPKDSQEFARVIEDIQNYADRAIREFFDAKIAARISVYDRQITTFTESGEQTQEELAEFRSELEEATLEMKETQNRKEALLEHLSGKFNRNATLKRYWRALSDHKKQSQAERQTNRKMERVYKKNLLKKAFFPWRRLTYREGHEHTVHRQTQKDISSIHAQYQSIVDILKQKILETDEVVRIKRAAKGEFAYALSKNLLRTISNLSLEVMSLNQLTLNNGEPNEDEAHRFLQQVDSIIAQKLQKVRQFKESLVSDRVEEDGKRKKKITFA